MLKTASDVIESLQLFDCIIVSGPQRSGTTVTAKMLSMDLNMLLHDESEFGVNNLSFVNKAIGGNINRCFQAPGMTHCLHLLENSNGSNACVVWMDRPTAEIEESQERIGWKEQGYPDKQLSLYSTAPHAANSEIVEISEIKKWHWRNWQKEAMRLTFFEMQYGCDYHKQHEIWCDKEQRVDFLPKQIYP
jgi:hypothetical protein